MSQVVKKTLSAIEQVRQNIASRKGKSYMGFQPETPPPSSSSPSVSSPSASGTDETISVVFRDEHGVQSLDNIKASDWEKWQTQYGYTEIHQSSAPLSTAQKAEIIQQDQRAIPLIGGGTTYASHAATKGMDEQAILDAEYASRAARQQAMIAKGEGVWIGPDNQPHLSQGIPYGMSQEAAISRGFTPVSPGQLQMRSTPEGIEVSAQISDQQRKHFLEYGPGLAIPIQDRPMIAGGIPASIQRDLDKQERERLAQKGKKAIQKAWRAESGPTTPQLTNQVFGKTAALGMSTSGVINWDFLSRTATGAAISTKSFIMPGPIARTGETKQALTIQALKAQQDYYYHIGAQAERAEKDKAGGKSLKDSLKGEAQYQITKTPFILPALYYGGKLVTAPFGYASAKVATAKATGGAITSAFAGATQKLGTLGGIGLTSIWAATEADTIITADDKAPQILRVGAEGLSFTAGASSGYHFGAEKAGKSLSGIKAKLTGKKTSDFKKQEIPISTARLGTVEAATTTKQAKDILGITKKNPTQAEIKKAFRVQVKKYHPDLKGPQASHDKLAEVNAAHAYLTGRDSNPFSFIGPSPRPPGGRPVTPPKPPVTPPVTPPITPVTPITPISPVVRAPLIRRPEKAFNPIKALQPQSKAVRVKTQAQRSIQQAVSPFRALRIQKAKPMQLRETRISKFPVKETKGFPSLLRVPRQITTTLRPVSAKRFELTTTKHYPLDAFKKYHVAKRPTTIRGDVTGKIVPYKPRPGKVIKPRPPKLPGVFNPFAFTMDGSDGLGGTGRTGKGKVERQFRSIGELLGSNRMVSAPKSRAQSLPTPFKFLSSPRPKKSPVRKSKLESPFSFTRSPAKKRK